MSVLYYLLPYDCLSAATPPPSKDPIPSEPCSFPGMLARGLRRSDCWIMGMVSVVHSARGKGDQRKRLFRSFCTGEDLRGTA
jgi:hypothetical protein